MSIVDELTRAAIEQGAHDGGKPRNKTDAKTRNPERSEKSAWNHIVYRASTHKGLVLGRRLIGNRLLQSRISDEDRKAIMDAYLLARG